jgi:hypothetical protein
MVSHKQLTFWNHIVTSSLGGKELEEIELTHLHGHKG